MECEYRCAHCRFVESGDFNENSPAEKRCVECNALSYRWIAMKRFSISKEIDSYMDEHMADNPVLVKNKKHKKQLMKKYGVREKGDYFS